MILPARVTLVVCASLLLVTSVLAADPPGQPAKAPAPPVPPEPLAGTGPLSGPDDLADMMVAGIDRFLLAQIERTAGEREKRWQRDLSSPDAYAKSMEPYRQKLARILGVRDPRPKQVEMELVATTDRPALVGKSDAFEAHAVRWRAFADVHGEGLLLTPVGRPPLADVIALPDADQTPEQIAGLAPGVAPESQFARRLAETGCRVIVPVLIDRHAEPRPAPGRTAGPELSNREFVYRTSFELGRHVIGYEIQKVMAAVDWCQATHKEIPVGLFGYGEGGMIAFYATAIDPRIRAACVSGYFGRRDDIWTEPIERNVFGLLREFGDAEVAAMIIPRGLIIEQAQAPHLKVAGKNAAPGQLKDPVEPMQEDLRGRRLLPDEFKSGQDTHLLRTIAGRTDRLVPPGHVRALRRFLNILWDRDPPDIADVPGPGPTAPPAFDPAPRQQRQLDELIRHSQQVLAASYDVRKQFMSKLDTSSVEKYQASAKPYRDTFYNDVLGRFDLPLLDPNPRSRKIYDTDKYTGYDLVLDVFPDVWASGILLLPKDIKPGDKRPVVVCQHGLEGRPKDCIEANHRAYHAFAARLAEQGYIVFAPQNPYLFGDRFRTLVRKANPIGKGLWSVIIPQHQQILTFLKARPEVDPSRIAFYGLSYGGKTAMRVPAVLTDYCLSICSGDFNEWVFKNCTTSVPWSYVYTGEYEIFEWDLGSTFNYAEMAALIAPRPFMVERGHADGVATDEYVAFEFAKVRRLYAAGLKLPDRCAIEFFPGPHEINGKGTFEFLDRHLQKGK